MRLTRGFLTKRCIGFSPEQSSHYGGTQSNFHLYNGWVPQFTKIYGGKRCLTNLSLHLWFLRVYPQMSSTKCHLYFLFICNSIQASLGVPFVPGCKVKGFYTTEFLVHFWGTLASSQKDDSLLQLILIVPKNLI